jgi:hypothetical protein
MYRQPTVVTEYYKRRPPRCCFTCEYFLIFSATCTKFDQVVPESFAKEMDKCPEWVELRVPF